MYENALYKTNLPNLLHGVLIPSIINIVYLEENYRFVDTLKYLYTNVISKQFENMDDTFHIITCGSMSEMEKQVLSITGNVQYITQYSELKTKFNLLLTSTTSPIPIICKSNYYVNNQLSIKNGTLCIKKRIEFLFIPN
jgi:hypothetical protein